MAPYKLPLIPLNRFVIKHARTYIRAFDNLATLKLLREGFYEVDANKTIDDMARRISKERKILCSGFNPRASLYNIKETLYLNKLHVTTFIDEMETEGENAAAAAEIMAETSRNVKRQLGLHFVAAGAYALGGLGALIAKKRPLAIVCFSSSVVNLALLWDELTIRGEELNEQFNCVRDTCDMTADGLVDLAIAKDNHNFACKMARERFGDEALDNPDAFVDGTADPFETYDPDAEPTGDTTIL